MASKVPFRELVRYAIGGGWGTDEPTADSLPVRVIRGTDFAKIASGAFDEIPRRFEVRAKVERRLLQANDIVLEISGGSRTSNQTTGRTLFVTQTILDRFEEPVIPASFCRLVRVRDDVVVPRYAYFVLQEMYNSGRAGLYEHHSTGISNFQFEYFLDQEVVWLPPLPEQRAIAHILGTLDDKIELNRRMSQTLEAMARALFKAWFVDFEPVRAKTEGRWQRGQSLPGLPAHLYDLFPDRLVDSELGEIPEGWRVGRLGELSEKPQYGYTASAKEEPVGPKFLRITDINKLAWIDWPTVPYCEIEQEDFEQYRLHPGDVLIARMADPGHGVVIEEQVEAVFASYLIRFRLKDQAYIRYIQYWLRSDRYWELVTSRYAGTTRASLNAQVLSSFQLIIPPKPIASAFSEIVNALRNKVVAAAGESRTLAALRDAILPKLIRGEIRVKDAERFLKERISC
jgi:type I restriction enzyme S subunit